MLFVFEEKDSQIASVQECSSLGWMGPGVFGLPELLGLCAQYQACHPPAIAELALHLLSCMMPFFSRPNSPRLAATASRLRAGMPQRRGTLVLLQVRNELA